jgi:hypothetical protein
MDAFSFSMISRPASAKYNIPLFLIVPYCFLREIIF